nr:MAG TPA: hypothetical protein [Caudoviricetes sp.]DAS57017.1 MAG TPA: hypothetical protein [Caudoviricetes sp.]
MNYRALKLYVVKHKFYSQAVLGRPGGGIVIPQYHKNKLKMFAFPCKFCQHLVLIHHRLFVSCKFTNIFPLISITLYTKRNVSQISTQSFCHA